MLKGLRLRLIVAALVAGWCASAQAVPENVASVTVDTTTGTPLTADGLTYDNTIEALTDLSDAAGTNYTVISSAPNALVQRNGTPDQSSVWYAINGSTGDLAGVNQTDYPTLLESNNLLEGADNVFVNSNAGKPQSTGNIERLDYTWNAPLTNLNQLAFAVFDRGNAGAHDAFTIAIVTGVGANGIPTSYGGFLKVAANWGGATNISGNPTNQLLRYSNGNDISARNTSITPSSDQNTQGVGGVVLKVSDFNLPQGTQVYGYSLMGNDVSPTTPNDLLDVTNTTVFPNTTTDSDGGIDLAAINGLQLQGVPEPAAWVLLCAGGGLAGAAGTRRRLMEKGPGWRTARR